MWGSEAFQEVVDDGGLHIALALQIAQPGVFESQAFSCLSCQQAHQIVLRVLMMKLVAAVVSIAYILKVDDLSE